MSPIRLRMMASRNLDSFKAIALLVIESKKGSGDYEPAKLQQYKQIIQEATDWRLEDEFFNVGGDSGWKLFYECLDTYFNN